MEVTTIVMGQLSNVVENNAQFYRGLILRGLEDEDLPASMGYVICLYNTVPLAFRESFKLTPAPTMERLLLYQYRQKQLEWILDNLRKIEAVYSKALYAKYEMLQVLTVAVSSYRNTITKYINAEKSGLVSMSLLETMNILLPEGTRAQLDTLPEGEGMQKLSWIRDKARRNWTMKGLQKFEDALATYVARVSTRYQH